MTEHTHAERPQTPQEYLSGLQDRNDDWKLAHYASALARDEEFIKSTIQQSHDPQLIQSLNAHLAEQRERAAHAPTKQQNAIWYALLDKLVDGVAQAAKVRGLEPTREVVYGTLPLGTIMPMMIEAPNGGLVIAIDDGTFTFLQLMAKAASSLFPTLPGSENMVSFSIKSDDLKQQVETNVEGFRHFFDAVLAYAFFRLPGMAPRYFQQEPQGLLAQSLWHTAETFVVAHEYAHALFVRNDGIRHPTTLSAGPMVLEVTTFPKKWDEELAADAVGLNLTLTHTFYHRHYDLPIAYMGVEFFFACLAIVDMATGIEQSESHPSAVIRRDNLRGIIKKEIPDKADEMIELGTSMYNLVWALWEKAQPFLEQLRQSTKPEQWYINGVQVHDNV